MNNISKDNDDVSSLKMISKNQKENNILTLSTDDRKSAFKKEILQKMTDELSDIDCEFPKNIERNASNISSYKKVKSTKSVKKKKVLKSADNFKKKRIKISNINKNTSSEFSSCSVINDDSNSLLLCQFCEKEFETTDDLSSHKCKKEDCDTDSSIYKCKFCSLTFSKKHKLNRHIEGHKRNNCTICSAYFTKRKALCKHLKFEHNIVEPEKMHPCSFCSKNFCNKSSLHTHMKTHANGQHFCLKCGFMCDSQDVYNDHIKEHIKNSKYECHLCGKKFVRRQQHDQHMMGHERHLCSVCNITYSTKKLLLRHCQSEHGARVSVKKHECPICKKLFLRPKHLQIHQRIHTGEKRVKCSHCEKLFCDEKSLSKHMKTVKHLQRVNKGEGKDIKIEKTFLCSECGARFYRKQSLIRHGEVKHSVIESFKCCHCDYSTKCKTNYKRHLELHTDVKRFICEICGSSFRAHASLKEHHTFVHSESRDFICSVCNKGFKNKSTLLRHSRIHSEVRPYKCYCDRDYKRMSHLKRHMLSAHHMTLKKNHTSLILESTNLEANDKIENLASALELLPDDSSCDDFSLINIPGKGTSSAELKDSDLKETSNNNEQLCVSSEGVNFTNVPSSTMQTLFNKCIPDEDPKSTSAPQVSESCEKTPLCLPPDPDTSSSISLDDPNLNLSPNNFCDFNLPSSPLNSLSTDNPTSTLVQSITSQDVLSFSSSDNLNRPHSLPNLNFQTPVSSIDSFTHFSLQNSNSPTSPQLPSFLLSGDIPSPSHVVDLNLDQNCTSKQLFGDSDDILSLPSYLLNNQLSGVNCPTSQFFSSARDIELWDSVDCSNKLRISDGELVTTSSCASFSTSLTSNSCNLLAHNLLSSNDTFEDSTLMSYSLEHISLNPGFDALSNLC